MKGLVNYGRKQVKSKNDDGDKNIAFFIFHYLCTMATIKLRNATNSMAKLGTLVRVNPKNPSAFQYVTDLTKLDVIGTVANAGYPGSLCTINLINEGSGSGSGNSYFPSGW
jgi:hypothetical protein